MCGGSSGTTVTQEIRDLAKNNIGIINAKLGTHHTSFEVGYAESQIVNGTNYILQLTAEDGQKYTVRLHVPFAHSNSAPSVLHSTNGHVTGKDLAWH